ncbi:AAA family ATPase [Corallococcus exiguus]|uniref:AAA family ATPase n=1 Tax=Corallococcus exiguus TaxID=83462 RepID=UPI001476215D|nr:AAA family ATPase [Corallococcus exiguus]NNB98453.1 AAA family ATPase [Corallococcus exiguus]
MSRLIRINIDNYRAFEQGLALELRPLTLVYGKNNAGKSSIVRLLGILDDSLSESAESPLDLRGNAGGGMTFVDCLSARNRELKRLRLSLTWDDSLSAKWTIGLHNADSIELVQIEDLLVEKPGETGQPPQMCWYGNPKIPEAIQPEGATPVGTLSFRGLVPQNQPDPNPLIALLQNRLAEIRGHVQYLTAVRSKPASLVFERGVQPTRLSADGGDAESILLTDKAIASEIGSWLRQEVGRDLRRVSMAPKTWKWLLPPTGAPELDIALRDTGEGMGQLLPILVATGLRKTATRSDGMAYLALEEPTTHLHDDLQIRLATHFARIAMESAPPTIVLETHARPLLLGIQLAILKGDLDPSRVLLYWVEQDKDGISRADPVEFNSQGLPTTPRLRTAFEDERRILRELSKTHIQQGGAGNST